MNFGSEFEVHENTFNGQRPRPQPQQALPGTTRKSKSIKEELLDLLGYAIEDVELVDGIMPERFLDMEAVLAEADQKILEQVQADLGEVGVEVREDMVPDSGDEAEINNSAEGLFIDAALEGEELPEPSADSLTAEPSASSGTGASSSSSVGAADVPADVQVSHTTQQKGLISIVHLHGKQAGMLHAICIADGPVVSSLKATCRFHKDCKCWVNCAGRAEECKQRLIHWLGTAGMCEQQHREESRLIRESFGMKTRKGKD